MSEHKVMLVCALFALFGMLLGTERIHILTLWFIYRMLQDVRDLVLMEDM